MASCIQRPASLDKTSLTPSPAALPPQFFFPHSQTFITPSVSQETNFAGLNLPCFNTAFLAVIIFPNRYYTFGSFRCRCCQDVGSKLYKQTNLSGWNIQPPPLLPLQHRLYFPAFSNPLLLHYGIRSSPSSIPLFLPSALSSTWKEEGGGLWWDLYSIALFIWHSRARVTCTTLAVCD